jgi:hypothetical protein
MSNTLTQEEIDKLLAEFEKMLEEEEEDDFGFYQIPMFPEPEDLEYPEEPPPIPKKVEKKEIKCSCGMEKTYGKIPNHSHAKYCDLNTKKKNENTLGKR